MKLQLDRELGFLVTVGMSQYVFSGARPSRPQQLQHCRTFRINPERSSGSNPLRPRWPRAALNRYPGEINASSLVRVHLWFSFSNSRI